MVISEFESLFGPCEPKVTQYRYIIASPHHNDFLFL